jgi:hypothetical protein
MPVAGASSHRKLDSGRELARLARMQWHADWRSHELEREVQAVRAELREAEQRAAAAERRAADLTSTLRWRVVQRLLRPLDNFRGK